MPSTPPVTEREKQLEQDLNDLQRMYEVCHRERLALAAQVDVMRERMNRARNILTDGKPTPLCNWGVLSTEDIPALSTEILRKHDAKVLRDAAVRCENITIEYVANSAATLDQTIAKIYCMAAELEGKGK